MKQLGIDNSLDNPTYTLMTVTNDEIIGLFVFLWNYIRHKCLYKQRHNYIAESTKCSTKPLSKLLISILSAFKSGLQIYSDTCFLKGWCASNTGMDSENCC